MNTLKTEAWVLYKSENPHNPEPGQLVREFISFPDLTDDEILVEPVIGCWEANMSHALNRHPVDVCWQRREEKVILGNSGVVRVLQVGKNIYTVKPGDECLFFPNGVPDEYGYPQLIHAYDAPGTIGFFAKQFKARPHNLIPIPKNTAFSIRQWAPIAKYITAWANWQIAYGCWKTQMNGIPTEELFVAGWGGGVALAELILAGVHGFKTIMMASTDQRLNLIQDKGIIAVDRRQFLDLEYDPIKYTEDPDYRKSYQKTENIFLEIIQDVTNGKGISIFIDNIGTPVYRATLRSLARQGVITTAGWKHGMEITTYRAIECIKRHIHVNTHFAKYEEGVQAVTFAEENDWLPQKVDIVYEWENIPRLAKDYAQNKFDTYYPLYAVNP